MLRKSQFALFALSVAPTAPADNGQVAYALQVSAIRVDGDLSDWPDDTEPNRVAFDANSSVVAANKSFSADFRAGCVPGEKDLFLALEITDDSHSVASEREPETDPDWTLYDSAIAYVDFN